MVSGVALTVLAGVVSRVWRPHVDHAAPPTWVGRWVWCGPRLS